MTADPGRQETGLPCTCLLSHLCTRHQHSALQGKSTERRSSSSKAPGLCQFPHLAAGRGNLESILYKTSPRLVLDLHLTVPEPKPGWNTVSGLTFRTFVTLRTRVNTGGKFEAPRDAQHGLVLPTLWLYTTYSSPVILASAHRHTNPSTGHQPL